MSFLRQSALLRQSGWDSESGREKGCSVPFNPGLKQLLDYYECYAICRVAKSKGQASVRKVKKLGKKGLMGKVMPKLFEDTTCGLFMPFPCSQLPQSDGNAFPLDYVVKLRVLPANSSFGRKRMEKRQRRNCSEKGCPQRNSKERPVPSGTREVTPSHYFLR